MPDSKMHQLTAILRKAARDANETMLDAIDFLKENKVSLTEEIDEETHAALLKQAHEAKRISFEQLEAVLDRTQHLADQHDLQQEHGGDAG